MADKKDIIDAMGKTLAIFKEKFATADVEKQKDVLDHATAILKDIDENATLKAELKEKRDEFENIVKLKTTEYETKSKTTYKYVEPADHAGDREGAKLEIAAAKLGDKFNHMVKSAGDYISNLFSSDKKKDDKGKPEADKKPEAKKFKKDKDGNIVKDKDGNPVEASWFDDLDVGNMLGGLAGGLGGWLVGSMFGGGWLGMIMGGMLAIGGMFLGKKALGSTINGWLGRPNDPGNPKADASPELQKQKTCQPPAAGAQNQQAAGQNATGTNQEIASNLTPEQQQHVREAFQSAYIEVTGHPFTGNGQPTCQPSTAVPYTPTRSTDVQYRR